MSRRAGRRRSKPLKTQRPIILMMSRLMGGTRTGETVMVIVTGMVALNAMMGPLAGEGATMAALHQDLLADAVVTGALVAIGIEIEML